MAHKFDTGFHHYNLQQTSREALASRAPSGLLGTALLKIRSLAPDGDSNSGNSNTPDEELLLAYGGQGSGVTGGWSSLCGVSQRQVTPAHAMLQLCASLLTSHHTSVHATGSTQPPQEVMGHSSRGAKASKGQGTGDRDLLNAHWWVTAAAATLLGAVLSSCSRHAWQDRTASVFASFLHCLTSTSQLKCTLPCRLSAALCPAPPQHTHTPAQTGTLPCPRVTRPTMQHTASPSPGTGPTPPLS
jgi:hypothetical protein